jgi:hypothetical protein
MRAATHDDQPTQLGFYGGFNSSEYILRHGFATGMLVQHAEIGSAL